MTMWGLKRLVVLTSSLLTCQDPLLPLGGFGLFLCLALRALTYNFIGFEPFETYFCPFVVFSRSYCQFSR